MKSLLHIDKPINVIGYLSNHKESGPSLTQTGNFNTKKFAYLLNRTLFCLTWRNKSPQTSRFFFFFHHFIGEVLF